MTHEPRFDDELKQLGARLTAGAVDLRAYRAELTAMLRRHIGCDRVGLWQIVGEPGERVMRCLARDDAGSGYSAGGDEIREHEYRDYFIVLVTSGAYVCENTWDDPNLAAMRDAYLVPHDVRSLMDAAFTLNGRTFGVVCCEQLGKRRAWTTAEVTALKRYAAMITLQAARHEHVEANAGHVDTDWPPAA